MQVSPKDTDNGKVKRLTWGIFDIAYVPVRSSILHQLSVSSLSEFCMLGHYMFKLFLEAYESSRSKSILFVLCHLWVCAGPAVSLYLAFKTLQIDNATVIQSFFGNSDTYTISAVCWIVSVSFLTFVHREIDSLTICLAGHMRARLLPRIAEASLRLDVKYPDKSRYAPDLWAFGSSPEMDILRHFSTRLSDILRVILELSIIVWILCERGDHAARVFTVISILMIGFSMNSPTNYIGGAGYTFWTNHPAFYKLQAYYSIIFDPTYRETVCKDGIAKRLGEELREASDNLGVHDIDTVRLSCYFKPVQWYWELGQCMILDNSMVIFAVILIWCPSPSALSSMALIQYAASMMKPDFYRVRRGYNNSSIIDTMKKAQAFYQTIEYLEDKQEFVPYPTTMSSPAGMKISFRNVCVIYERKFERIVNAVKGVSVDIEPGQFVIIVGKNGSGKSSLLKLLPQIGELSSGDIQIDDRSVNQYDVNQIRNSMAVLSQDEELFPLSLRDNMLLGLTERGWGHGSTQPKGFLDDLVHHAAVLGSAQTVMRDVGWNTVLNPVGAIRQSTEGAGNGKVERGAFNELDRCAISLAPRNISGGERQRLLATRAINRAINDDNVRLIVADEPSSALDPISERALFNQFIRMRNGRTIIIVTHRFRCLAEHADLILCMDDGRVVERGTHAELILKANGSYARLYNAQGT